jgi:cell division transport system ATP-binding protein
VKLWPQRAQRTDRRPLNRSAGTSYSASQPGQTMRMLACSKTAAACRSSLARRGLYAGPTPIDGLPVVVRLEHVGLRYGKGDSHEVLRDLSFSVPAGGFRWLLGPSGAGKSSLLRLLYLDVRPTRGQLAVLDTPIATRAGRAERAVLPRLRRRIGVVFQDFRLLAHLSAYDNIALPLRIAGRPEGQIRADVNEIMAWVGLAKRREARPPELSGGEQQRVAIARAVISRPTLLLADEPTGNLDDQQAERLMQLLKEMNRLGTAVIVATHNEALVGRHPGARLRLSLGRLIDDEAAGQAAADG